MNDKERIKELEREVVKLKEENKKIKGDAYHMAGNQLSMEIYIGQVTEENKKIEKEYAELKKENEKLKNELEKADNCNESLGCTIRRYHTYIKKLEKENEGLKEFVLWMTGCGYDFTQHKYFIKMREKFLKGEKYK